MTIDRHGGWHVHLHVLIVGRFWAQREISSEWLAVTGDSSVVDIRALPRERAVNYAAKYVGKGIDSGVEQKPEAFVEAIKALKGRRMLIVFGEWMGKLSEEIDDDSGDFAIPAERGHWRALMSVEKCVSLARQGDEAAVAILNILKLQIGDFDGT